MPLRLKLLLDLLETGSLPVSRLRSSLEGLRTPLHAGLLQRIGRGSGEVVTVANEGAYREWLRTKFPGAFGDLEADASRAANLAMGRDSKRGLQGLEHFAVAIRAHAVPQGLAPDDHAAMTCIVEATRRFGAAGLHLRIPEAGRSQPDPTLPKRLRMMTIENPTNFLHTGQMSEESDVFLLGGTGGRLREALVSWIAAQEPREVIHFGDYDPVGLQEFERLANRMPGKVRFHLHDDLENLFQTFSNRGILDLESNRVILASLHRGLHPSADLVLDLLLRYGPLEQEAVLVRRGLRADLGSGLLGSR